MNWDSINKTVTIMIDGKVINLKMGGNIMSYDTTPMIYKDLMMVPIRYIADQLGTHNIWISSKKQVDITK